MHYRRFRFLEKHGLFETQFEDATKEYVAAKQHVGKILVDGTHVKARCGGGVLGNLQ